MSKSKLIYLKNSEFKERLRDRTDAATFDNIMLRKQYVPEVRQVGSAEERRLSFIVSTEAVDRDNDTISVKGWVLKNFRKNPVVLFGHGGIPIAKSPKISKTEASLDADAEFLPPDMADHEHVKFSDMVFQMLVKKFLRATSVGFRPLEFKEPDEDDERRSGGGALLSPFRHGMDFLKQELLEFSIVPVPANPEAVIQARSAGIDINPYRNWLERTLDEWEDEYEELIMAPRKRAEKALKLVVSDLAKSMGSKARVRIIEDDGDSGDVKRAISFQAAHPGGTPKQDPDTAWNGSRQVAQADVEDLLVMAAWRENKPRDELNKGDFKLPHHAASGQHPVNLRGTRAAIGALLGARGGVDIPDEDRRPTFNHLARHVREFDEEPPEFRFVDEQVLAEKDDFEYIYDLDTGELLKWEQPEDPQQGELPFLRWVSGGKDFESEKSEQEKQFEIQSIAGRKSKWDSLTAFTTWAKDHGFRTDKVDETSNFWRLHQRDPNDFESLRTICINPNNESPGSTDCKVQAVGGERKEKEAQPGADGVSAAIMEQATKLIDERFDELTEQITALRKDVSKPKFDYDRLEELHAELDDLIDASVESKTLTRVNEKQLRKAADLLSEVLAKLEQSSDDEEEDEEDGPVDGKARRGGGKKKKKKRKAKRLGKLKRELNGNGHDTDDDDDDDDSLVDAVCTELESLLGDKESLSSQIKQVLNERVNHLKGRLD